MAQVYSCSFTSIRRSCRIDSARLEESTLHGNHSRVVQVESAVADPTAPAYLNKEAMDHVWIHSVPWIELAERNGLHVFDRGEGSTLYDVQGNAYLDGIAGLWVVNAGHGREEIAEAMAEQAAASPSLGDEPTPPSRPCSSPR